MCFLLPTGQQSKVDVQATDCPNSHRVCGGKNTFAPTGDSDVNVVADLTGIDIDTTSFGESQEGAEAQQVEGGDERKHRRPRACRLDEIPRKVHH